MHSYETYFDLKSFAETIVVETIKLAVLKCTRKKVQQIINDILSEALDQARGKYNAVSPMKLHTIPLPLDLPFAINNQENSDYQHIKWPTIAQFSAELGQQKIEEFISTWPRRIEWLYSIDFVSYSCDSCSYYFLYEVRWSIPTPAYPIPQAVASVFFTIEASRIKPDVYPVQVMYTFEGHRFAHTPGKTKFCEKFLQNIIDSKIEFIKEINF